MPVIGPEYMVRDDSVIICSVEGQVHYPVAQEDACVLINRLIQEKQELKSALENLTDAGDDVVNTSMLGGSPWYEHYEVEVDSYERIEESTKKARQVLDNLQS